MGALIITCEHATNFLPSPWRKQLAIPQDVLDSHRGWDPGAVGLAELLARKLDAKCFLGATSRLLVELNRSPDNPALWSEYSRVLSVAQRAQIMANFYSAYRTRVYECIHAYHQAGVPVTHLSIHSFTPVFDNTYRTTDIGILFDPAREHEVACANRWRGALAQELPTGAVIHDNQPYKGTDDGLTTLLRTFFPDEAYAGLELEVNQRFVLEDATKWPQFCEQIAEATALLVK